VHAMFVARYSNDQGQRLTSRSTERSGEIARKVVRRGGLPR
jgi:hypothetical protein